MPDSNLVRRIYDEWERSLPDDAETFGGPDGNLYVIDDEGFWAMVDAASGRTPPENVSPKS